ncbi:MAG TPA: aminotransferase class I/II-fold pyridoxal phosphate-dependent enzyme [Ramlibacter sp.]|uniref:aminotransferase class I/II-fold pyridoxal phosphate-dependent enzyme n=1 Tax=Ramlibacter sp. TaxID=1917967 RepID=UPI002D648F10|nr:aminotransferase class I/II-fold pyridoxal phosphate-dependent enzyme [Ramlibacter sp.]HZY18077.1 aminotransferase class I/II-fold pyridoxal phosphate-dependent enzyme [Ramlibacter sp.]
MSHATRVHGGPDARGAVAHDFSTNANACGPCPRTLAAVQAADAGRYPDGSHSALREALARRHGVTPERIVMAASASEFIFRCTGWAARAGLGVVALPPHGYGDYAAAAHAWALAAEAGTAPGLAWACEPSSPCGGREARWDALAAHQGPVVLDRAYEPLRLAGAARAAPDGWWQLWSPNKALGLTGVRGAYAVAPAGAQALAAALEALAPSWLLGAHGVAMLADWCEPATQEWLAASLATLRAWKREQVALCESFGWTVLPGDANFFVARATVSAAQHGQLRAHGVQLRDCASFGLPGHVRLGVRPPDAQQALRRAWEAVA